MEVKKIVPPVLILVLFLGSWHVGALIYNMAFLLPTPYAVLQTFINDFTIIMIGLKQTFQAAFTGYIIAAIIGIAVATIMSLSKILERSLYPYAILLQTVPVVAVAPLIVLWFGFEIKSIIIISVIIALFPIINNTLLGLKSTSKTLVELFDYHNTSKLTSFWKLRFPAAIPNIIAGLKISAGLSVIGAIVGEFIIGSGSEQGGLGVQIIYAQANLETSLVMALILTATMLGFAFFITVSTLGWYLLHKWHESEQ
jgi:NitT/TauT family transport system permease protein|tara:strand:- start:475 stop:1239 length:765 start_codon:yes stop_codon:yes gene_type:complete